MRRTITEKPDYRVLQDTETSQLIFELNDKDIHSLQAGIKSGKSSQMYLATPALSALNELVTGYNKPILVGNEQTGYQKITIDNFAGTNPRI